ncbi:MAG TPA: hypothetical protein VHD56_17030 [Tepidisphaeraceae bacterium]|nr:hypothetical protein [Tepidisphaeraceae bacterium]
MKSTVLWALVVVNAVLLGSFLWRVLPENRASAQRGPAIRSGDYLMIPAEINGGSSGIIVLVDQIGGQLSAISYDDANQKIENMTKIDLRAVFQPQAVVPARGAAR